MKKPLAGIRRAGGLLSAALAGFLIRRLTRARVPRKVIEWRHLGCTYSQFGEDVLVQRALEHLKLEGRAFYVDVGCHHPFQYSNTLLLHWRGWQGVNIDPVRQTIDLFNQARPSDTNLCIAVSDRKGRAEFLEYTIEATCRLAAAAGPDGRSVLGETAAGRIEVETDTLASVLRAHAPTGLPFGFLNVDCEGADLAVLQGNDWTAFRPWIIAVEDAEKRPDSDIQRFCESLGYEWFAMTHLTRIFIDTRAAGAAGTGAA